MNTIERQHDGWSKSIPRDRIMEIINRSSCKEFVAQDKAVVRELVSPRNSSLKNQSIAEVIIPIGITILEH